jgi:hypothetical protein
MPWWTWIVIWIALVALSLLFFVVLGVRLFRQFMATVTELREAGDRFSRLPSGPGPTEGADALGANTSGALPGALARSVPVAVPVAVPVPGEAVFASPARMRRYHRDSKLSRQEDRRVRRIQRKRDRGQPQSLYDIDFS